MSITIGEIVRDAEAGHLGIPEVQRQARWDRKRVRLLIDSLYRGFPVGTLTIWRPRGATTVIARGGDTAIPGSRWVLDGQQRTTALCILFGKRPCWSRTNAGFKVQFNPATQSFRCVVRDHPAVPTFRDQNRGRGRPAAWVDVADIVNGNEDLIGAVAENLSMDIPMSITCAARMYRLHTVRSGAFSVQYTELELEDFPDAFARIHRGV
jgi:hypothetical protein